jgi:hypothetical protein
MTPARGSGDSGVLKKRLTLKTELPENYMSSLRDETIIAQDDGAITSEIDDESVIFIASAGVVISLNSVGTDVWRQLAHQSSVRSIISALMEKYDVDSDVASRETREFIHKLIKYRIVRTVPRGGAR